MQNKTNKKIAGVKGTLTAYDMFGAKLSDFAIAYDGGIDANGTAQWARSRSVTMYFGTDNHDRHLAALDADKYTTKFEPQAVVFADGTKLEMPR